MVGWLGLWFCLTLAASAQSEDNESYTRVLDRLTSIPHFADRPVLFIIGFDTTKSMSVEFDRAKRVTQLILSRYGAPEDQVFVFGFANTPSVLAATSQPKTIPKDGSDSVLAGLNEGILSLPRSSEFGTVFGRAKLFALQKAKELGARRNVVVMLFSDNNSELEMGVDERKKLDALESSSTTLAETIPLLSQGVSPLWMTLYTNAFPDTSSLVGPAGETDLENPRLAWAARRMGSQVLEFIEPSHPQISQFPVSVSVQFLGSVEPKEATLTVNGQNSQKAAFVDGRASWSLAALDPGSHLLFAQALLPDGKVRTAELSVTVASGAASTGSQPSPGGTPSASPQTPASTSPSASPTPAEGEAEGSGAPWFLLLILAAVGAGIFLLSTRPARVRLLGAPGEESYVLSKGQSVRLGGTSRVDGDRIFAGSLLPETIAEVVGRGFGKALIRPRDGLQAGRVEVEMEDGLPVSESGEVLVTSATVTWTSPRGQQEIFTVLLESSQGSRSSQASESFGGEGAGGEDDSSDWRS